MNYTQRRERLRKILSGTECRSPASVYDALSARAAESVGYELGMLAGSVASNTTLGAPDLIVLTMSEFADQIYRIQRAASLSLFVDADHGYGNALNVMRTVEECEHSGVSGMSIEDTYLPTRFGAAGGEELISIEEGTGKMKAALAARKDPALVIAGRTSALKVEGVEGTVARAKAYAAAGVDAIFLVGVETIDHVKTVRDAVKIPIIVGSAPASLKREDLAAAGARILLQGHMPIAAAVKALREVYEHLHKGGAPADLKSRIASNEEMAQITRADAWKGWQKSFLR
ncbi:MAG TPA: isocitrate lyase/phosphoenolpyruvate mutase family protein [Burkholderiales bacterium]|nr:isocitrate lyase/phosphoenolpyruvate mutase family protein [Burkholderiales bacterium]